MANGFKAVPGRRPIKLATQTGVIGCEAVTYANGDFQTDVSMTDRKTFSVVYNAAGKIVTHEVRVRNMHGLTNNNSTDMIFNTKAKVDDGTALFLQDDYSALGLEQENSCRQMIIFDKKAFSEYSVSRRWVDYLVDLGIETVNPYTGELVDRN